MFVKFMVTWKVSMHPEHINQQKPVRRCSSGLWLVGKIGEMVWCPCGRISVCLSPDFGVECLLLDPIVFYDGGTYSFSLPMVILIKPWEVSLFRMVCNASKGTGFQLQVSSMAPSLSNLHQLVCYLHCLPTHSLQKPVLAIVSHLLITFVNKLTFAWIPQKSIGLT